MEKKIHKARAVKTTKTKTESVKNSAIKKKTVKVVTYKEKEQVNKVISTFGLFNLKIPCGAHKRRKIKGRGSSSGHGKTSTRGSKGQTSRSGRDFYIGFEGGQSPLIRKIPKRGFVSNFKKIYQIVNLKELSKIKSATITPALLEEKGLIKDKDKLIKILGNGEFKNTALVQAHAFSRKASEQIKNAGGKIEVINV